MERNIVAMNSAPSQAFGEWARLFSHVTDNDKCVENPSYSWLFTDPLKINVFPEMGFGPGSAVIHNWLDDIIVSPWVQIPDNGATGTVLTFREFPGNSFRDSRIARSWSVRTTPAGSSCRTVWSNDCSKQGNLVGTWDDLSEFGWVTRAKDLSLFVPESADSLQVRFRVSDWQYIYGATTPVKYNPGPGPYIDRVRIGRLVLSGPVISIGEDSRTQAQDAFPDRWFNEYGMFPRTGTTSFSAALDLASPAQEYVMPGDSIYVSVVDQRNAGGVDWVRFYGAIVSGPHKGKAPAPYVVGANGFFVVEAEVCMAYGVPRPSQFCVSLDDRYFRGGDRLLYYWQAADGEQGESSHPPGISGSPSSVEQAQILTAGLHEVSFLPTIDWDAGYLARIAADDHGDLVPTVAEVAASPQRNCILYVNKADLERRSLSRTSFMWTLDALGYGVDTLGIGGVCSYDVYDVRGYGNIHNDLMSRCSVTFQANGYALIIHDAGRLRTGALPDGSDTMTNKQMQDMWYANWLETCGQYNDYGFANLWLIGENVATHTSLTALLGPKMGLTSPAEVVNAAPLVSSSRGFSFIQPLGGMVSGVFPDLRLTGGCPKRRDYDRCRESGDASATHQYDGFETAAAVVMRHATTVDGLGYTNRYNTIWMGFPWADIESPPGLWPAGLLAQSILNATVVTNCGIVPNPTDLGDVSTTGSPNTPGLYQNTPNPCNPRTAIEFDLTEGVATTLGIYNLSGRRVRTLVNGIVAAGHHRVPWDGTDDSGNRVASGVYVYRLTAGSYYASRKLVVLK